MLLREVAHERDPCSLKSQYCITLCLCYAFLLYVGGLANTQTNIKKQQLPVYVSMHAVIFDLIFVYLVRGAPL